MFELVQVHNYHCYKATSATIIVRKHVFFPIETDACIVFNLIVKTYLWTLAKSIKT